MINVESTKEIAGVVQQKGLTYETVSELRQRYPKIHFTYCMDDDISNGKPVLEESDFNVYLIDGREHCLCLTNDFEVATGVVLAEIIDDEDD